VPLYTAAWYLDPVEFSEVDGKAWTRHMIKELFQPLSKMTSKYLSLNDVHHYITAMLGSGVNYRSGSLTFHAVLTYLGCLSS
jgi:hypothetical protein